MSGSPKRLVASLTLAGVGVAVAMAAAVPATATAASQHHVAASHHAASKHHRRHVHLMGIVASHHHRTMTVFAKTAKIGAKTRHNERFQVRFAHTVHGRTAVPVGDHVRLTAVARTTGHHLTITRNDDETVTPAPASLFFGTVEAITGNLLTVTENERDNGDHHDGDDHGGDGDNNDSARPADRSPGGPGDGGNNRGHQIMIDDTTAVITVDGAAGTLAVGDTVAVLGESADNTVVAASVFGFTAPQSFVRGEITAISGDNVTFGDDHGHDGDDTARDQGDNDQPLTVSLTGVPLALNGDEGATTSQLTVGDKLIVIGTVDATTSAFTPELAFAFNGDDDHPCGDNDGHGHRGDGGSDG